MSLSAAFSGGSAAGHVEPVGSTGPAWPVEHTGGTVRAADAADAADAVDAADMVDAADAVDAADTADAVDAGGAKDPVEEADTPGATAVRGAASAGCDAAYLGALTGVRSGKRSYYPAYVRSAERLQHAVQALDRISTALVRTVEGPRALVEAVVLAAAEHLRADWLLFALSDGALRSARPRFLLLAGEELIEDERRFPAGVKVHLQMLRHRPWDADELAHGGAEVGVCMSLDGEPVGGIVGLPSAGLAVEETDLAVLRVLANQAAVALHNSFLAHAATLLRGRSERLHETATQQARDLAARNAELQETQRRLIEAMQRQALDDERHRIARELHDGVTQDVLSAGMAIEICRAELTVAEGDFTELVDRLTSAKETTRRVVERLRAAIYALHHASDEPPGALPVLLDRLSTVHLPADLKVSVQVHGEPVPLSGEVEHALLRIAGEALFNTVMHTSAHRALVRLGYHRDRISLTISDDGDGDPAQLRKSLRLASAADLAGLHRGLANMKARAEQLGGNMSIRRSAMGGIMLTMRFPLLPAAPSGLTEGLAEGLAAGKASGAVPGGLSGGVSAVPSGAPRGGAG